MILILQGLPGAGKTTMARRFRELFGFKVVSKDHFFEKRGIKRPKVLHSLYTAQLESAVQALETSLIKRLLANGDTVVVDDTNLDPVRLTELAYLAQHFDVEPFLLRLVTPLDTCIANDRRREFSAGEAIIRRYSNRWRIHNLGIQEGPNGSERPENLTKPNLELSLHLITT